MITVTAERIGNSSKERILVNGEVFLKSVTIGRWNYIAVHVTASNPDDVRFNKATNRASAEKWRCTEMQFRAPSLRILVNGMADPNATEEKIAEFMAANPTAKKQKSRQGMNYVTHLVGETPAYIHQVIEIERAAQ